jgi:hypothetical protein
LGRRLTKDEVAHVVHQTRPAKEKNITEGEVQRRQRGEISFFEKRALRKVVVVAGGLPLCRPDVYAEEASLRYAMYHVFERQSVVPQHQVLEAALVKGCGQIDLETAQESAEPNAGRAGWRPPV